jgi:hypothetical protein
MTARPAKAINRDRSSVSVSAHSMPHAEHFQAGAFGEVSGMAFTSLVAPQRGHGSSSPCPHWIAALTQSAQ